MHEDFIKIKICEALFFESEMFDFTPFKKILINSFNILRQVNATSVRDSS